MAAFAYNFLPDRIVTTFKEYLMSDTFRILNPGVQRPALGTTGATRVYPNAQPRGYRYASKGGAAGTRRSASGTTKSPRDKPSSDRKTVHSLETDLLDNDDANDNDQDADLSVGSDCDLLDVHAMSIGCILCSQKHDPYMCPLLKGNVEEQRAVFAKLANRRTAKVQQLNESPSDDDDLLSFGGSDLELDFR